MHDFIKGFADNVGFAAGLLLLFVWLFVRPPKRHADDKSASVPPQRDAS